MRNEESLGSAGRFSRCLLALLLLREAAGATFFRYVQDGAEPVTQICNESFGRGNTAWWIGKDGSSLLSFERRCCRPKEILHWRFLLTEKYVNGQCSNNVSLSNFTSGGILACKTMMEKQDLKNKIPLFTSRDDCTNFNFFIVAIIKSPAEQSSENNSREAEEKVSIGENKNLILSCEFELGNDTTTFAVYWFKGTKPSKCLFSATNEGCYGTPCNFSYNINCCIDDALRARWVNSSTISGDGNRKHRHIVTITKSTVADTGSYFCVVAAYNKEYRWTIQRRISVTVEEASPLSFYLKISLAAIAGGLLLIGGIVLLLCCMKKAKGKPLENPQRDQTTVATEDCSPYAVSTRNDVRGHETVYSLATGPVEAPSAVCFTSQGQPAPGGQLGENVEVLYSKVSKDRNGPSLASDSSV